jgi:hypothetical protein
MKRNLLLSLGLSLFLLVFSVHFAFATETPEDSSSLKLPLDEKPFQVSSGFFANQVVLQGLDKITARVFTIKAALGEPVNFEKLSITVRKCWKASPEDPPESIAYLEVSERKADETLHPIFKGWMFASSPSVSAMEHPVYDLWVKECSGTMEPASFELEKDPEVFQEEPKEELKAFYKGLGETGVHPTP